MLVVGMLFLGLWVAGLATAHTMGGFIHALFVFAVMALLSYMIRGSQSRRMAELRSSASQPGTWGHEAR